MRGCQLRCLRAFAITWYHTFFLKKNWNNSIKMQKKNPNQKEKKKHWERSWNRSREKDNWVGLRSVVSVWETCLGFWRWLSAHPQITIPGARSYGISHTLPHTKLSISLEISVFSLTHECAYPHPRNAQFTSKLEGAGKILNW